MANNIKADNIVSDTVDAKSGIFTANEVKDPLNNSAGNVTDSLNRVINLPSTVITPGFGLYKLSQDVAVFRTSMSLIASLTKKWNKIKTITDLISKENDFTSKEQARAKVHLSIAKAVNKK